MKINWFSPLPPARTGIAHYAMQVLPVLVRQHAVTAWTDQDQVASEVRRVARVKHYDPESPPWREINEGAVSFYHLGNDPDFHAGLWRVRAQQPGIVVLHDLSLHHFFFMLTVHQRKDYAGYLAAMEHWYGDAGRQAGEACCAGGISPDDMAQRYPLTREATREALGAITHTESGRGDETPACPLLSLKLPYAASDTARYRRQITSRQPGPPYRLVVLGYLSRNRRLGSLLEALATLAERKQFRLDICGKVWDESHFRAEIERLELGSLVSLCGFLPERQIEHKLAAAHLAINLRFPSMGEASASQLQFWNYGLPTLVTRTGWYATLPEDSTAFVRPEHEVEDIQAQLRALLDRPEAFRAMGERGRQLLENHNPEGYAEALTQFASAAPGLASRAAALALAGRVGGELTAWLHPATSSALIAQVSAEICRLWGDKSSGREQLSGVVSVAGGGPELP
ncbi:MAG TPA: glycosyltransferase family 4 protein [Bryobacteraceae bacterium]|nr:glycosyltransferase family 4 protein [Bryobacteraceae bacterium]